MMRCARFAGRTGGDDGTVKWGGVRNDGRNGSDDDGVSCQVTMAVFT